MERAKVTTVEERALYLEHLEQPKWSKASQASQAREIEEHFGIQCSRQKLQKWLKEKDVIKKNAAMYKSTSKHAPSASKVKPVKRLITELQMKFEAEHCENMFLALDKRNVSLEYIMDQGVIQIDDDDETGKTRFNYLSSHLFKLIPPALAKTMPRPREW